LNVVARLAAPLALAMAASGVLVLPAAAAPPPPPEEFHFGVAAVSATRGRAELTWKTDPASSYSIAEVVGGTPVARAGMTTGQWSSNNEAPGWHTYRLTRTLNGESSYGDATVLVPTRSLIGTVFGSYVISATAPGSNANGATLSQDVGDSPDVSPDRRTLVAQVRDATGTSLWLFDTEGKRIRALTQGRWDSQAAFSPDGRTVAFVRRDTFDAVPAVWTVSTTANAVPAAVTGGANASSPAWTADGKSLVLEVGDAATADPSVPSTEPLVVVRLSTGARTALPGTEGGRDPAVSRTDRVAFAQRTADLRLVVAVTDLSGGPVVRWSPEVQSQGWGSPAWDPQGTTLAMSFSNTGSGVGPHPSTVTGPGQQPSRWLVPDNHFQSGLKEPVWLQTTSAAPTATLTVPAFTQTATTTATIAVADADDAIAGLQVTCRIDSAAWMPCAPGAWPIPAQKPGTHVLSVKVTDPAGGTATVTRQWVVDQLSPSVTLRGPAQPFTLATSVPVSWTGSDWGSGVSYYQVRWNKAAYNGGFGPWQYPAGWQKLTATSVTLTGVVPAVGYCFQVRAVDKVGNAGAWSTQKCSAVALDDRSLGTSAGWSRTAWNLFYRGTATETTKAGSYLTRPGSAVSRVAVVATRCPTCGTVGVYVNGASVGSVNLYSATTVRQSVVALPPFAYRTGTVMLKVLSTGKFVQVDGLGISRT
jgi:hypothetical protein